MTEFTDQHLSAYIDGELSEELARALREALGHDADLADRLRALEQANQTFLSAHSEMVDEPIPEHLLDIIADAPPLAEDADNVIPLPARSPSTPAWIMPLAACLVLAIGVGLGARLSPSSTQGTPDMIIAGPVAQDSGLHQFLETVPSGQTQDDLTAILSFASVDGGYCRELGTSSSRSVACRAPDQARWTVLASVADDAQTLDSAYIPASANPARAIEQVVDQLIVGIPLSAEAESKLLAGAWNAGAQIKPSIENR